MVQTFNSVTFVWSMTNKMSQQYKPVPCKGCGKPIVFEKQLDGKWLVSEFDVDEGEKLGKHNCPNYKPKTQQTAGGWTGTNKQGQMFEARESQDRVNQELERTKEQGNKILEKMFVDLSRQLNENTTLLHTFTEAVKEIYNMTDAIFKHFELHKPEPASEAKEVKELETNHDGSDYGF